MSNREKDERGKREGKDKIGKVVHGNRKGWYSLLTEVGGCVVCTNSVIGEWKEGGVCVWVASSMEILNADGWHSKEAFAQDKKFGHPKLTLVKI